MTTPGVDAITEQLYKAYSDGQRVKSDVETTFGALNSQVGAMMARFQGVAPAVFLQKHEEWKQQITRLILELERITLAAKGSADRHQELENVSKADLNNV